MIRHRITASILAILGFFIIQNSIPTISVPVAYATGPTDMTAWWKADGDATDSAGDNDGVLTNGTTFATGKLDQAFSFDGINDYVNIADTNELTPPSNQLTLSAWVKPNTVSGTQAIVAKVNSQGAQQSWMLQIDSGGKVRLIIMQTGDSLVQRSILTNASLVAGVWTLVTATFDNTDQSVHIYLNGVDQPSTFPTTNTVSTIFDGTAPVRIGSYLDSGGNIVALWNGLIDDVRIFNRPLSPQEVLNTYDEVSGATYPVTTTSKDTVSRLAVNELANHTIAFTTPGGVAVGETMNITFPGPFSIPGALDFTDIDLSYGATGTETEATLGATASGATWGASFSGKTLTLTSGSGTIPATSTVIVEIGTHATAGTTGDQQITNASTANMYIVSLAGTFGETAQIGLPITDTDRVSSTAIVIPSITFDIDSGTSQGADNSSPHLVSLGSLTPSTLTTSNQSTISSLFLDLSTNAVSGATISVASAHATGALTAPSISSDIDGAGVEQTISAGTEMFGICIESVTATTGTFTKGTSYDAANCNATNTGTQTVTSPTTTSSQILNTSSAPINSGRAEILFKASISTLTPAASDYSGTLTFIATGIF